MITRCRKCGKPLRDARSLERGMGSTCYRNHGGQCDMFLPSPPVYSYEIKTIGKIKVLSIVDLHGEGCPSITVTNGVELVLNEITRKIGALPKFIVYKDTDGFWDRIKARPDGTFVGFAPIKPGHERPKNCDDAFLLSMSL